MIVSLSRRRALQAVSAAAGTAMLPVLPSSALAAKGDPKVEAAIEKGLKWVAKTQSSLGHWTAGGYPTAMTALAGTALIASGSTTGTPSMVSIDARWLTPMPSRKRPPVSSDSVSAAWAMVTGWRG